MRALAILLALGVTLSMFATQRSERTYRCFSSRCRSEGKIELVGWGRPFAYVSREVIPGDPPSLSAARIDPVALTIDVVMLGMMFSLIAIVASIGGDTSLLRGRSWVPRARAIRRPPKPT
ncbi:MAG: hypothetical protein QM831_46485 [Kofleriaceae bacterium]